MKILLLILLIGGMGGCASKEAYKDYSIAHVGSSKDYSLSYNEYLKTKTGGNNGKLFELEPINGQPVTINGKLTVYAPSNSGDNGIKPPEWKGPQQIQASEWVTTVNGFFDRAASFGTAAILGNTVKSIFQSSAGNAGHNSVSTVNSATQSTSADQQNTSNVSNANQANTSTVTSADQANTTSSADQANTTNNANQANTTTHTPTSTTTITGGAGTTSGGTVTQ